MRAMIGPTRLNRESIKVESKDSIIVDIKEDLTILAKSKSNKLDEG